MDNKSTKKPSLFDNLSDETDDEVNDENTINEMVKSNNRNLHDASLNESNNCDVMVSYFSMKYFGVN